MWTYSALLLLCVCSTHAQEYNVRVAEKSAEITSAMDGDEYTFKFSSGGFPNLRMLYVNSSDSTRTTFRVGLTRIAEVTDTLTAYNTTAFTDLTGVASTWSNVEQRVSGDESVLSTWRSYPTGTGTPPTNVTFEFSSSSNTSSTLKFSVKVVGYKYTLPASRLAFVAKITSNKLAKAALGGGDEVQLGGGLLKWETWVLADGARSPLAAGPLAVGNAQEGDSGDVLGEAGESTRFIAFTVAAAAQPVNVMWDPELTTSGEPGDPIPAEDDDDDGPNFVWLLVLAGVAVVGAVAFVVLRKKPDENRPHYSEMASVEAPITAE